MFDNVRRFAVHFLAEVEGRDAGNTKRQKTREDRSEGSS